MDLVNKYRFLLILAGIMFIWVTYLYPQTIPWLQANSVFAYFLLQFVTVYVIMVYVFHKSPFKDIRSFVAFVMMMIVLEILLPPYFITPDGLVSTDPLVIASDATIYKMWNQPGWVGYYLSLIITPILMLLAISYLVPTEDIASQMKSALGR